MAKVTIVGGGLAGAEAAWQAAQSGCEVLPWRCVPEDDTCPSY